MKGFLRHKSLRVMVMCFALTGMLGVGAMASDTSTTAITTAFSAGFTKMASDALAMIAVIVPIALGVAGTVFLVRKAMGWFKGLAK